MAFEADCGMSTVLVAIRVANTAGAPGASAAPTEGSGG
jgi:hypothetical protein